MPDTKVEYVPFNAINEFMRPDFRARVLQLVFDQFSTLPETEQKSVNSLTRKFVAIPGFRNSSLAPASLKARSAVRPFENNAGFTGVVISCWASILFDLRSKTHAVLSDLGWPLLPADADRAKLPGFLTSWPKGQDFSSLNSAYREKYPEDGSSEDDISLMAVWLSGRLPIHEEDQIQDTK
jgi:hypothetical protein